MPGTRYKPEEIVTKRVQANVPAHCHTPRVPRSRPRRQGTDRSVCQIVRGARLATVADRPLGLRQ